MHSAGKMESASNSSLSEQKLPFPPFQGIKIQFLYLLLIIIFSFLYFLITKISKRSKNLPPIPPQRLPIIGHLHLRKKPQIYAHLADKYGPILLLYFGFRPILLISSASLLDECLGKNDIAFANRPKYLAGKLLGYDFSTLSWAPYGQSWRHLRKIATVEILSTSRIKKSAHVRAREVHELLRRLLQTSQAEMKVAMFQLSMNVMMRMIAGKRYYGGGEEQKTEEARRFRAMIREASLLIAPNKLADYLPWVRWFGLHLKLENVMKRLHAKRDGFMQFLIDDRRRRSGGSDGSDDDQDMLAVLLSLQRDEPEYYTDEIIKGMMLVMLIGGSENTALAMEWAFAALLNHPKVLNKAHQEIQNHIGTSSRLIDDSDLAHLPYLQAIIDETLRLYAVTDVVGQHETSEECIIGGYNIPRGTILFMNTRYMHSYPEIWGEDAHEFKPERFLDIEKEEFKLKYLPFGLGRRRCPAENYGRQVIGLALSSLIQCFEWSRVGEELVDMSEIPGALNLARSQPFYAACRPRPEIVKLIPSDC